MASFTFGSFGDIITLTQIAYKVYNAIGSNGDLAKRLKVSKSDRETFLKACASVERAVKVGGPMTEDDAAAVKHVVAECNQFLAEFEKYLDKFTDPRQVVRFSRRVQSALFNKDESTHFQERLRHHSMMLGLVLGPIQAKYTSLDLKAHITNSLEPWDQKPMQFQDALGRRYPVPLEVCSSFDGLLNFLQFAFKSNPSMHSAVEQQQFWMITPKRLGSQSWYVVQEEDWESIARPGASLGMVFYTQRQERQKCHPRTLETYGSPTKLPQSGIDHDQVDVADATPVECSFNVQEFLNEFVASVGFNNPMPPWAVYHPDTRFQLLSPMKSLPSPALLPTEIRFVCSSSTKWDFVSERSDNIRSLRSIAASSSLSSWLDSPYESISLKTRGADDAAQNASGSQRVYDSPSTCARRTMIDAVISSEEQPSEEQDEEAKNHVHAGAE